MAPTYAGIICVTYKRRMSESDKQDKCILVDEQIFQETFQFNTRNTCFIS